MWDCAITKNGEFCILACDDGAPRKIQIEDNDIFLAKQYAKNDCIYILLIFYIKKQKFCAAVLNLLARNIFIQDIPMAI